jgi:hypothetical protein
VAEPDRPTGYLIDSNVLLDIATEDPQWYRWSSTILATAARGAPLLTNPLICAEVSANYETVEELDDALPERNIFGRALLPYPAGLAADGGIVSESE